MIKQNNITASADQKSMKFNSTSSSKRFSMKRDLHQNHYTCFLNQPKKKERSAFNGNWAKNLFLGFFLMLFTAGVVNAQTTIETTITNFNTAVNYCVEDRVLVQADIQLGGGAQIIIPAFVEIEIYDSGNTLVQTNGTVSGLSVGIGMNGLLSTNAVIEIPTTLPPGTGYYIRVVINGTGFAETFNPSAAFDVIPPSLTTGDVIEDDPFCVGDTVTVDFTAQCLRSAQGFSRTGASNISNEFTGNLQVRITSASEGIDIEVPAYAVSDSKMLPLDDTDFDLGQEFTLSGTGTGSQTGQVKVIIPDDQNLPYATDYRFTVETVTGDFTTDGNGGNDDRGQTITGLAITMPDDFPGIPPVLCQGEMVDIEYSSGDTYNPGNEIRAMISDASGNFNNATPQFLEVGVIGRDFFMGIPTDEKMSFRIPFDLPGGTEYKIRLVSTDPEIIGCEYGPIVVPEIREPLVNGTPPKLGPDESLACLGATATFTVDPSDYMIDNVDGVTVAPATYQWQQICTPPFITTKGGLDPPASALITDVFINGMDYYAATGTGLVRSTNSGVDFTSYTNLEDGYINKIAVDLAGTTIYAAAGGILKVSDGLGTGADFTDYSYLDVDAINDILIVGSNIYLATDEGIKVVTTISPGTIVDTYIPFANATSIFRTPDNDFYFGTNGSGLHIAKNADFGALVQYDNTNTANDGLNGLPNDNDIFDVFVSPEDSLIVLATGSGISISTNKGWSFQTYFQGLGSSQVLNTVVEHYGTIYAGNAQGLWVTSLGASGFSRYSDSDGLGGDPVLEIFVSGDANNHNLILATSGGISKASSTIENIMDETDATLSFTVDYPDPSCKYRAIISKQVTVDGETRTCSAASSFAGLPDIPGPITAAQVRPITYCDGADGQVLISGLIPTNTYTFNRGAGAGVGMPTNGMQVQADPLGNVLVSGLTAGDYEFSVTSEENPNCPSNIAYVTDPNIPGITLEDPAPPVAPTLADAPAVCVGDPVVVTIDLPPGNAANTAYQWFTNNPAPPMSPTAADGEAVVAGTQITFTLDGQPTNGGSLYVRAYNGATQCTSTGVLKVDYEVNQGPSISAGVKTNTTNAAPNGGIIPINGLTPGETYTLSYTYDPDGPGTAIAVPITPFDFIAPALVAPATTSTYEITGLTAGFYTGIMVTFNDCPSNTLPTCLLVNEDNIVPEVGVVPIEMQTVSGMIMGGSGGYFQSSDNPASCAGDDYITDGGIAVGRIRDPLQPVQNGGENLEMRGFVQFDLSSNLVIPSNVVIDKIEYRAQAADNFGKIVCGVTNGTPVQSATGDIQFDITQVDSNEYAPYVVFDQDTYDDLGDTKYADFTISKGATGAWTDLGPEAVIDLQNRMATGQNFQVGLRLSGNDFDLALYQFHGIVFDNAALHKIRITYHQLDYGDLPLPYGTLDNGGSPGASHRIDLVDVDPLTSVDNFVRSMYIGGTEPDPDANGQPNDMATGDDDNSIFGPVTDLDRSLDDEDIVYDPTISAVDPITASPLDMNNFYNPETDNRLVAGNSITFAAPITNNLPFPAKLLLFFDWNGDGVFDNQSERKVIDINAGTLDGVGLALGAPLSNTIAYSTVIDIPSDAANDNIGVRLRLTTEEIDAYEEAPNGEVEDLFLRVFRFDYGDLPDDDVDNDGTDLVGFPLTEAGDYHTLYALDGSRGPRHLIREGLRIGNLIDSELDGQPQFQAFGDDIGGIDDEDGIIPPDTIRRDKPAVFNVFVVNETDEAAYLQGFADWDDNGSFALGTLLAPDPESPPYITIQPGASGLYEVVFNTPAVPNPLPEKVAVRFRLSTHLEAVQLPTGPALVDLGLNPPVDPNDPDEIDGIDGEVQDLFVNIVGYDWGDLPEPLYITDANGGFPGPSHKIEAVEFPANSDEFVTSLYIGDTPPDAEIEGNASEKADGDDTVGDTDINDDIIDDEDLTEANFIDPDDTSPTPAPKTLIAGEDVRFQIPVTNNTGRAATLWAFIDWNADGDFDDELETRFQTVPAVTPATNNSVNFNFDYLIPELPEPDSIGIRVRVTTDDIIDAYGEAYDGEVEDLFLERRGKEYGDLPDLTAGVGPDDFRTYKERDGARHGVQVTPLVYIGAAIDTELDGQPNADASGDDNDAILDDEDGIIFLTPLIPGQTARIAFSGANLIPVGYTGPPLPDAELFMFADWENDGTLELVEFTTGSSVLTAGTTVSKMNPRELEFTVPGGATFQNGNAYFRFRLTTDANYITETEAYFQADPIPDEEPEFGPNGLAEDGEVEDYLVPVFNIGNLVWEDRNNNGFQDAEEIGLGIEGVRIIVRFGGINPATGEFDGITQGTLEDPLTTATSGANNIFPDFIFETVTDVNGLYSVIGNIEGLYQVISIDPYNLTPTRPDWIDNVTEEDRDSDGVPLLEPWEYDDIDDIRQAKSQVITLLADKIGTDEEGILDQKNPGLLDPNEVAGFPDNRAEQRIDFGYTGFDFGDLPESYTTSENDDAPINLTDLFPSPTVAIGNPTQGPKHIVTPDVFLGACSDAEEEGNPDYDAGAEFAVPSDDPNFDPTGAGVADGLGDDPTLSLWNSFARNVDAAGEGCGDDETGVKFMTPLIPGYEAIITVDFYATINNDGPDAFLQAYFDWNGDGNFYNDDGKIDKDEQIIFTQLNGETIFLEPNTLAVELEMSQKQKRDPIQLMFKVPKDAKYFDGNILSRFRIGKQPNLGPTGILPSNDNLSTGTFVPNKNNFNDGIVPFGEVEDYFMKLSKVGNIVWEDRDYDGIQDKDEPVIAGVEITLDFSGATTDFGDALNEDGSPNDDFEKQYIATTDKDGKFFFAGLIGSQDPSGIMTPTYRMTAADPDNMTPTVNRDDEECIAYNSNGNDDDIDDRITAFDFVITNPMGLCQGEGVEVGGETAGICDMGDMLVMEMEGDDDNIWPDMQIDETLDFGYVGFDYGDLADASIENDDYDFDYITLRDWLPGAAESPAGAAIEFGPRHAIQPKLYLGSGVDAELNGQPDFDAGSKMGGDDDFQGEDPIRFFKGDPTDPNNPIDDESGIRLLTPLLPGEYALIRVDYTSMDTTLTDVNGNGPGDDYVARDAFLNAFIDWSGNGAFEANEAITFTHEALAPDDQNAVTAITSLTPTDGELPGTDMNGSYKIFAFRVPDLATTNFNNGTAFMRFRLSWTGGLDPHNNRYHQTSDPHVILTDPLNFNYPTDPISAQTGALAWVWNPLSLTYPQGEVEDYAVPLAKVGNLAWFDHNVNGRQDEDEEVKGIEALYNTYVDEYGVDDLQLVLIWGGVDSETGLPDAVGYQDENCESAGSVEDVLYNLSIGPDGISMAIDGEPDMYAPDDIVLTQENGLYSFRGLIPGTYNLIPRKYLQPDSTTFVEFWPKHRVLTIKNNVGVNDSLDSDAGPGAVFTIADVNQLKDPEVCVDDLPLGENGQNDDLDLTLFPDPFFPDSLYDQTIDFGWVDEPNIEAVLDLVGVDFPTSETCGNFNVIYFLCLKNPTETPLDSIVPFLDIYSAYGDAFIPGSAEISIVEQAFLTPFEIDQIEARSDPMVELDECERQRIGQVGSESALTEYINDEGPNAYDGKDNINLLTGGDTILQNFYLPGDSTVCIRIEFEINPAGYAPENPWMIQGGAYARAIGFEYDATVEGDWMGVAEPFKGKGLKTRLIDWMPKIDNPAYDENNPGAAPQGLPNPRFGKHIEVYDLSDEYDDPWPGPGTYSDYGDGIRFEGSVADRGADGLYIDFPAPSITGEDKYLDEDDKTIQNDECWLKTFDISGQDNIIVSLNDDCEIKLDPSFFISNHMKECGFDRYPEGSYYRVVVQDKHTEETLWASVDREPFDGSLYLDRKLIYKARSVANSCTIVWGNLTIEDKTAPVVTCPDDIEGKEQLIDKMNLPINTEGRYLVCTDIDSVLNNPSSYLDDTYAYFTGIATAVDNCTEDVIFDGASDVLEVLADCEVSANNDYAYARIVRTFLFKDRFENKAQCTQTIYFYRPQIVLPDCEVSLYRYDVGEDRELTPADLITKYERPEAVPYIVNAAGDKVYLTEESVCGFGLNWTNEDIFISTECSFKIVRKWRILDWCNDGRAGYPDYLIDPFLNDGCHDVLTWTGNAYEFEQLLIVEDKVTPIVGIPDLDEDGFKGQNGYKGGPQANPLVSTDTYDAEDIFIFETSGFDCSANFSVSKSMFEVEEDGEWCFDLDVVIRQPILDLDERKTGRYEFVNDPNVEVTGDCEGDYWVSGAEMKFDTTMRYFFQTRFYDECGNDTLLYIPFMVVDRVKPVVVCNDELFVTYDNFGTGRLSAADVDEGTSDNCGKILWLKVRRPVNDCADGYRTLLSYRDANNNSIVDEYDYIDEDDDNIADSLEYFRINEDGELMSPLLDEVNFFCCDGDSVKVELWASDKVGNVSNCWQYATLTNRPPLSVELPGNYILPSSKEINCQTDEDQVVFLTSGGRYAQGSLSYNAVVSILGGDLFIPLDNTCTSFTREMIITPEIGDCGFGYIDVEWVLSNGEDELTTESRRITIVGKHNYWIKFPKDARSNCASPNPDTIEYAEQSCDLLAIAVLPEERFDTPQDQNSCYKIFRTYQVINWCEYDGESNPVIVSRDWDAFNAETCFDTDRIDDDTDEDDSIAGEYHLNPSEPDGDDIAGNTDLYVIVDIDNANDGLATVYYDSDSDPNADVKGLTDDEDTDLIENYWWAVTREQSACNYSSWYDDSIDGNFNGDFDIDGTDSQDDNDDRYGSFGFWQYTQHIIVYDEIDPELTVVSQDTFYAQDGVNCMGTVSLEITAEDICDGISTNLVTRVIIDGEEVGVGTGTMTYEGSYSLGTHSLIVTTRDACDNTATFTQDFEVVDGKAPAPIVHEDAIVELGSVEGGGAEGQIWATDLVASPIYDCTGQDDSDVDANGNALVTKYSINIVGDSVKMDQVGLLFTCDDAQNSVEVEIHAWDEAGNHDFVVTTILVQDNNGACDIAAGTGQISGGIATPDDELVNEVEVRLSGADQRAYLTNATGSYVFDELTEGADYTVIPSKDDFHSNGLTTFDVILLQRHAIGAAVITDPYQLIAADVNKSGTITTLDLIQLRKLILGIDERFANNTSWRFIDAAYTFNNPANPFGEAFPEVKNINNLAGAEEANFFAVKIGDLNGSASAYVQPRSSERFTVNARSTDRLLDAGKEYQIDFTASGLEGIQGYQFSMQLGSGVELIDMVYGESQQEHFGVFTDQGVITTSWNGQAGSEAMFSLVLRPEQDIALGDAVQLSNRYTPGEAYKTGSEQIMDVVLKVSASAEGLVGNALYQNRPNPFMGETQIRFELGTANRASLQVRDVTGRLVKLIEGDYEAGLHQVRIKHSELPAAGVYYYTLEAGDFTATKKMILME